MPVDKNTGEVLEGARLIKELRYDKRVREYSAVVKTAKGAGESIRTIVRTLASCYLGLKKSSKMFWNDVLKTMKNHGWKSDVKGNILMLCIVKLGHHWLCYVREKKVSKENKERHVLEFLKNMIEV